MEENLNTDNQRTDVVVPMLKCHACNCGSCVTMSKHDYDKQVIRLREASARLAIGVLKKNRTFGLPEQYTIYNLAEKVLILLSGV